MYVLFNGFIQPIEVVSMLTGISEHELLIDDSFDVYDTKYTQIDVDDYEINLELLSQDERLSKAYPIKIYAPAKKWSEPAGYYPENHSISYEMIPDLCLPF